MQVSSEIHQQQPIISGLPKKPERKGLSTEHGTEPGYNGVEYRYSATILKPEALEIGAEAGGRVRQAPGRAEPV